MPYPSITDIVALIGILVMLWKTFFSKADKGKLTSDVKKTEAEADKLAADTADKYEDAIQKLLARNSALDAIIVSYDKRFADQELRISKLEKENKKLNRELDKRDTIIDCLEIYYRELAQKAVNNGVKDVVLDPPCFTHMDE